MKIFDIGDVVEIPGDNKILGAVMKTIGDVTMVALWNSGHEDIFLTKDLKKAKKSTKLRKIQSKRLTNTVNQSQNSPSHFDSCPRGDGGGRMC